MWNSLMNVMFGCAHRRTTFPLTPARKAGWPSHNGARHDTYVVCLDCGKEFGYNWAEMRIGDPVPAHVTATTEFSSAHRQA
jgi:hypothetical protein